jgi:hypothetical protein
MAHFYKSACGEPMKVLSRWFGFAAVAGAAALLAAVSPADAQSSASPAQAATRRALFGDLHLHTANSFDAFLGGATIYPADAYRFARGEEIDYAGTKVKRRVPLDFLAVTDHSEYLGALPLAADPKGPFASTRWPKLLSPPNPQDKFTLMQHLHDGFTGKNVFEPELLSDDLKKTSWQHQIDAAEHAYEPGKFTSFVAYEWSSMPNEANLHRNVIFRGPHYPQEPFSALDSNRPEDLWRYLDNNRAHGIESLAIPHNSNVSDGLMFDYVDSDKQPISKDYALTRARNERVVEIAQVKGSSETRPELSPTDEFASFELINNLLTVARPSKIPGSYVRDALARGLEIQQRIGVNPYRYGITASSDIHTGLSESSETEQPSYASGYVKDAKRVLADKDSLAGMTISSGGLTGVWAEANTREAIFDALERRETFGTSGTRLQVRMFAGAYPAGISKKADWVEQAYAHGAPMGSELNPVAGKPPRFIVDALKDPDGANLDRIQIVKVWLDKGEHREQVYDAVWSGNRTVDARTGKLAAIGSTVDVAHATYTNTIGAAELIGEWSDPHFDAASPAVYYARVLEIPTPRWTTYIAANAGLPVPDGVPATLQERGWTSPIFFSRP